MEVFHASLTFYGIAGTPVIQVVSIENLFTFVKVLSPSLGGFFPYVVKPSDIRP